MKKCIIFMLAFALMISTFSFSIGDEVQAKADEGVGMALYVSPEGDDNNPGTLKSPFATLERARDAIRELKSSSGLPDGGVVVYLREGEYKIERTFELTEQDSGTMEAPIVYRAYPNETVRLIGGAELPSELFQPVTDEEVLNRLQPEVRDQVLQFDLAAYGITEYGKIEQFGFGLPTINPAPELFFNDEAMTLSRWPNNDFVTIGRVDDPGSNPRQGDTSRRGAIFEYKDERPETWADLSDVWMYGYWYYDWADGNLQIEYIDPDTNRIKTVQPSHYSVRSGQRYYYYNILEELDMPGEWYLDRKTGILYLYPPSDIREASIQLSLLNETMVEMKNVSYVTFQGITFEASRGIGIDMTGGTGNLITESTFRNLGNFAVKINKGQNNGVTECLIYNTGVGGIMLDGGERNTLVPGNNYAVNNEIYNYSRLKATYSPAVDLYGVGNIVAHNEIYDAPHLAILIHGNNHVIEYNDIHDVLKETSDAGAIYMGRNWTEQGNVIRYNYLHDLQGVEGIGQIGIYLDDMATGSIVYGNIIKNSNRGMLIGGGRNNIIENNIMIENGQSVQLDDRGLGWARYHWEDPDGALRVTLQAVPYQEEPWRSRYPNLLNILEDDPGAPKYNTVQRNVMYKTPDMNIARAALESGTFNYNLVTNEDPGFVDAANENYALREDAPVFDWIPGFEPIPFHLIGIITDEDRLEILNNDLKQFIAFGEVERPLDAQLTNALKQVEHHFNKGSKETALDHLDRFLKHMNNAPMQQHISERAREVLQKDAEALIGLWTNDPLGEIRLFTPENVILVNQDISLWFMGDSMSGRYIDLFGAVEFTSSNPEVAVVDNLGKVTGVSPGKTIITATATKDGVVKSDSIIIKVVSAFLDKVILSIDRLTAGETAQLDIQGILTNGEIADLSDAEVWYESSNEEVATIDQNGLVNAKKTGAVTLTAEVELDGVVRKGSLHLVVYPSEESGIEPWSISNYGDANGVAILEDGVFTIISDGADVWGTSDSCTYIYQNVSLDENKKLTVTATVDYLGNTHKDAAAGIMIRDSDTAESKQVNFRVLPNGESRFVYRADDGGNCNYAAGSAVPFPVMIKLTLEGDLFTAYVMRSGEWAKIAQAEVNMDSDILVGINVFSHADEATSAQIRDVSFSIE